MLENNVLYCEVKCWQLSRIPWAICKQKKRSG